MVVGCADLVVVGVVCATILLPPPIASEGGEAGSSVG